MFAFISVLLKNHRQWHIHFSILISCSCSFSNPKIFNLRSMPGCRCGKYSANSLHWIFSCIFSIFHLNEDSDDAVVADVAFGAVVYGWVGLVIVLGLATVCCLQVTTFVDYYEYFAWITINNNCTVCIDSNTFHPLSIIHYTLCSSHFIHFVHFFFRSFMEFSTLRENKLINWLDVNCDDDLFENFKKSKTLNECCYLYANVKRRSMRTLLKTLLIQFKLIGKHDER